MPHIVIAGKIHQDGLAVIERAPGVTFDYVSDPDPKAYLPYLPKADGLLLRTQPLTAAHLATTNKLSIVSRHGVGYDAVDIATLDARKIPLAIVGDVNSRAVAEHTLLLMLASLRRTVFYDGASRNNWTARNVFDCQELDGKTVLVIGFGRIGRRVAQLVQAFGAMVQAFDPMVKAEDMQVLGATHAAELNRR